MNEITKQIKVDVAQPIILDKVNYITAKQGDMGSRFVRAKFANESEDLIIDQSSTVVLNAFKPDGTRANKIGKVNSDGSVTAEITNQMLSVAGQVDCDISIIDTKGSKLTSTTFFVQVQPASIPDGSIVSDDSYDALTELILRVSDIERNETARQTAEIQREENNNEVRELIDNFAGDMVIANNVTPGAVKAGGDISVNSSGVVSVVASLKLEIVKMDNPVGTIRYFAVSTNPSSLLGFGTWEQIAKGRAIVGVNTSDTDFSTVGKIGGAKNHTLTISEMPSHSHKGSVPNTLPNTATGSQTYGYILDGSYRTTETAGDGQAHNNLQPYECYYIWKRTA